MLIAKNDIGHWPLLFQFGKISRYAQLLCITFACDFPFVCISPLLFAAISAYSAKQFDINLLQLLYIACCLTKLGTIVE